MQVSVVRQILARAHKKKGAFLLETSKQEHHARGHIHYPPPPLRLFIRIVTVKGVEGSLRCMLVPDLPLT